MNLDAAADEENRMEDTFRGIRCQSRKESFGETSVDLHQCRKEYHDEDFCGFVAMSLAGAADINAVISCDPEIGYRKQGVDYQMRDGVDASLLGPTNGEGDEFCEDPSDIGYYEWSHGYCVY